MTGRSSSGDACRRTRSSGASFKSHHSGERHSLCPSGSRRLGSLGSTSSEGNPSDTLGTATSSFRIRGSRYRPGFGDRSRRTVAEEGNGPVTPRRRRPTDKCDAGEESPDSHQVGTGCADRPGQNGHQRASTEASPSGRLDVGPTGHRSRADHRGVANGIAGSRRVGATVRVPSPQGHGPGPVGSRQPDRIPQRPSTLGGWLDDRGDRSDHVPALSRRA